MLAVTENAIETIKAITEQAEVAEGAGVRIASANAAEQAEPAELTVTVASGPSDADHVLSGGGAQLFLDPTAAAYLDDKVLDAEVSAEGDVSFAIGEQGQADAEEA